MDSTTSWHVIDGFRGRRQARMKSHYQTGDRVVYTRDKYTVCPGPRAKNVYAAQNGDSYHYQVEKYWIVSEVSSEGKLILKTRRGKSHEVSSDDPRLRRATFLERVFRWRLFPSEQILQHAAE